MILLFFAGFMADSLISAKREHGAESNEIVQVDTSGKNILINIGKFLLGAAAAWLLSGQVIMAGVVCSLVATGVCMLLCGLLHMAVLAGHSGAGLTAAGLLLGRELLVSLPFVAAAHPLFRWARRTLSE